MLLPNSIDVDFSILPLKKVTYALFSSPIFIPVSSRDFFADAAVLPVIDHPLEAISDHPCKTDD